MKTKIEQECNIIILPTEDLSTIHLWSDEDESKKPQLCALKHSNTRDTQHLYITNPNEAPKKGDWIYYNKYDPKYDSKAIIRQKAAGLINPPLWSKIIASTDPALTQCEGCRRHNNSDSIYTCSCNATMLPQVPKEFIKEYCEAGGIDKVLVKFENNNIIITKL